jgi:predicted ATPase
VLWALGYAEQALQWSDDALASAAGLSQQAWLANALALTASLHVFLRDPHMTQERAEAAIAIASEHGFRFEQGYATFARGRALAERGQLDEGIAEMRRAVAALETTGFATRPQWFAYLAEPSARTEGPDAGLQLLAEGFALVDARGHRMFEAELHRLKGELSLMRDAENIAHAESCFRTAIEIARRQRAKSWELRATMSLARLLDNAGRRDEARTMLAEIYNWFTEGFDTADLKDAKALLDELAG